MIDWSAFDGLDPVAPNTGPFARQGFLGAWWRHRSRGELMVVRSGGGALAFTLDDGVARLAGEADLTDYHSPLGANLDAVVAEALSRIPPGTRLEFDSLPSEAAVALVNALALAGVEVTMQQHEAAMILALPADPEAYLAGLDGKQRHEVRRKQRRFQEQAGTPALHRSPDALETFAAMHRTAGGAKGEFMTADMEAFFGSLVAEAGAVIDLLVDGSGTPVGAAFGFEDADTYYLYNSAFNGERAALSPGIVLVAALIEAAIVSGRRRFDFLKGGEEYKVRLGGIPRSLYVLEGQR
jgi:CelD/BcsL family acetyltransferase involved in cellulose biosynthesis